MVGQPPTCNRCVILHFETFYLPSTCSATQIEEKTGLNRKLVGQVRSGDFSIKQKPIQPTLPQETRERVKEFYLDPANERISPRANDTISVKNRDGSRERRPRHLLNSTLHEAHDKYLQQNPNHPISRAQFCKERPGEVVLMGSAGSHTTYTCIKCRNPEMMVNTSEFSVESSLLLNLSCRPGGWKVVRLKM